MDISRQWFKSVVGLAAKETHRDVAFCSYTILESSPDVFVVKDATKDERFMMNPLVTGPPNIRFYAGACIRLENIKVGTFCVIDTIPRENFGDHECKILSDISDIVADLIAERRSKVLQIEYEIAQINLSVLYSIKHPLLQVNQFYNEMKYTFDEFKLAFDPKIELHQQDRSRVIDKGHFRSSVERFRQENAIFGEIVERCLAVISRLMEISNGGGKTTKLVELKMRDFMKSVEDIVAKTYSLCKVEWQHAENWESGNATGSNQLVAGIALKIRSESLSGCSSPQPGHCLMDRGNLHSDIIVCGSASADTVDYDHFHHQSQNILALDPDSSTFESSGNDSQLNHADKKTIPSVLQSPNLRYSHVTEIHTTRVSSIDSIDYSMDVRKFGERRNRVDEFSYNGNVSYQYLLHHQPKFFSHPDVIQLLIMSFLSYFARRGYIVPQVSFTYRETNQLLYFTDGQIWTMVGDKSNVMSPCSTKRLRMQGCDEMQKYGNYWQKGELVLKFFSHSSKQDIGDRKNSECGDAVDDNREFEILAAKNILGWISGTLAISQFDDNKEFEIIFPCLTPMPDDVFKSNFTTAIVSIEHKDDICASVVTSCTKDKPVNSVPHHLFDTSPSQIFKIVINRFWTSLVHGRTSSIYPDKVDVGSD